MEQTLLREGLGEGGDCLQDAVEELGVGVLVLARGVRQDIDDEPAVVLDLEHLVRVDLQSISQSTAQAAGQNIGHLFEEDGGEGAARGEELAEALLELPVLEHAEAVVEVLGPAQQRASLRAPHI